MDGDGNVSGIRCTELSHPNELATHIFSENGLSILNVNIRSLCKNNSKLVTLLKQVSFKVRILVITETWLTDGHNNLYSIKGYKHFSVNRTGNTGKKRGGGIRIYYCESLDIDIINDLTGIFDSHESLFVELNTHAAGKVKIGAIYRPPDKSIHCFNEQLISQLFNSSFSASDKYIVCGDMNIRYSPSSIAHNQRALDYFTLFMEYDFQFLVDKSTRVDKNRQVSIIDHIWSNMKVNYSTAVLCSPSVFI